MNPPGTRTAMPTVRRSNSTAKRWLGTEILQWSRRGDASPAKAALKSHICIVVYEKGARVFARRSSLEGPRRARAVRRGGPERYARAVLLPG